MLMLVFGSTAVLAAAMLAMCVRWFQRESVLFRS
jgi:sodium transport system permease protein